MDSTEGNSDSVFEGTSVDSTDGIVEVVSLGFDVKGGIVGCFVGNFVGIGAKKRKKCS